VPLEDRANTSYMKMAENAVAGIFRKKPRAHAVVVARYKDPPKELAAPFERHSAESQPQRAERDDLSFMDVRRVPDNMD